MELVAVDKTDELKEMGYTSDKSSFPMSRIDDVLTKFEKENVFGTFHTHPGNNVAPTNYMDPIWKARGNSPFGKPDDYYGYLSYGKNFGSLGSNTRGGHPAIIITKSNIVIYSTAYIKFSTYDFRNHPTGNNDGVFGNYEVQSK